MRTVLTAFLFLAAAALSSAGAQTQPAADAQPAPEPVPQVAPANTVASPLIERYILDELKALRSDMQNLRVEAIREITDRELDVADKAVGYSNNTVTFFFYVFLGVATILTLFGWNSLKELKNSFAKIAEEEVSRVSKEYEARLTALETELQARGEEILENHRQIEKTQTIRSLWLQSNQASNPRTKIEFYDRILELNPSDTETMAYKADAALQLGERDWALSLCNKILEEYPDSSLAYYQRACARVGLDTTEAVLADLAKAIELSETLRDQARTEEEFNPLFDDPGFRKLVLLPEQMVPKAGAPESNVTQL